LLGLLENVFLARVAFSSAFVMPHDSKTVSAEVLIAQKLASNQPKIRDRYIKKLGVYLRAKATHAANADQAVDEDDLAKIWKGIHYCFWHSDKMLVQEELAKKISSLVHVFDEVDVQRGFLPFVKCGLVTLGREWLGIDQWRKDKYMMLVRHFLRQTLEFAGRRDWKDCQLLSDLFSSCVIRAHPNKPASAISNLPCDLEFRLHFVDVFPEELAKMGGEQLQPEVIRTFLKPFVEELRSGREERLRSHVEERIFQHLMRQSDVGIAYEEGDDEEEEDDEDEDDGKPVANGNHEEEEVEAEDSSDEEMEVASASDAKDPRAGRVDVVIPQLMVDYEQLAEDLFEAGSDAKVGGKQRKVLYRLTKQFRALAGGKYPLSAELSDDDEEPQPLKVKLVRKRRMREDEEFSKSVALQTKDYREEMRRAKKRRVEPKANSEAHSSGQEGEAEPADDTAEEDKVPKKKIKKQTKRKGAAKVNGEAHAAEDEELTQGMDEEEANEKGPAKSKKHRVNAEVANEDEHGGSTSAENVPTSKKSKKQKKKSVEEAAEKSPKKASEEKKDVIKKKKQGKQDEESSFKVAEWNDDDDGDDYKAKEIKPSINTREDKAKVKKQKLKDKKKMVTSDDEGKVNVGLPGFEPPKIRNVASKAPTPVFLRKAMSKSASNTPAMKKKQKSAKLAEKTLSEDTKGSKKGIKIMLSKNRFQSVQEHSKSLQCSPGIPFTPEAKPIAGLLKNKKDPSILCTPTSPELGLKAVKKNTKINARSKIAQQLQARMRASDFF